MSNYLSRQILPIQVISAITLLSISIMIGWVARAISPTEGPFVAQIVYSLVGLWFLYGLYRGSNTVRWFVIVVIFLSLVPMPFFWSVISKSMTFWQRFNTVINAVLHGFAALLLVLPASSRWFNPRSYIESTDNVALPTSAQVEPTYSPESTMLDYDQTHPSMKIILTAFVVGVSSLVAGSIYYSSSNLGFIVAIFIAGPVGVFIGALIGIVWSAVRAVQFRSIAPELRWLFFVWLLSLVYMFVSASFGIGMLLIGLQALMLAIGLFLLSNHKVKKHLSELTYKCGYVFLCAAVLIVFTTMFLPVKSSRQPHQYGSSNVTASEEAPKFVVFSDPGFDASRHAPKFTIDRTYLAREWFMIGFIAGLVCLFFIISPRLVRIRSE